MSSPSPGDLYVLAVSVGGVAVLAALVGRLGLHPQRATVSAIVILLCLVVLAELWPVEMSYSGKGGEMTVSAPFVFAFLALSGVPATALALAAASAVADLQHRKPVKRLIFNVAQYTLSLGAAGVVFNTLSHGRSFAPRALGLRELVILFAAGAMFFVVNHVLTLVALVLHGDVNVRVLFDREVLLEVAASAVLVVLSPVVVVLARHDLFLLPALLVPAAAVHRSARMARAKVHHAQHDALTGLPNRALLAERIAAAVAAGPGALLLLDLDHFREINDTLGHRVGDRALQEVAAGLTTALGERGVVARLGGDEFAVLLPGVEHEEASREANRLLATLMRQFALDEFRLRVEASVGIALFPRDGEDAETLVRCADVALYLAKRERGRCEFYRPERDGHSHRRLSLMAELPQAIEAGELVVYYQPKADMQQGVVMGVEALVRWRHPVHGLLPPGDFIDLAERTVHLDTLTRHVLDTALAQCAAWRARGWQLQVAVNVSVQTLRDPDFPDAVHAALAHWEVPASLLELEITERTIAVDSDGLLRSLAQLESLGVRLAVDDFGTGYSSLAYLKDMPVHALKIDKSFVLDMAGNASDAAIVGSTVQLGHSLGLETVAEGVEDAQTWDLLVRLGCDSVQGYHLGRPLPVDELNAWLAQLGPALRLPPQFASRAATDAVTTARSGARRAIAPVHGQVARHP